MKKSLVIAGLLFGLASTSHAGFLSNFLSSSAANALISNGGGGGNISVEDKAKIEAKKVQSVLEILGCYDFKIDGDLNTFDSRAAIKKWQDSKKTGYFGFFKDKPTGILSEEDQNNLLYLGDLIAKADQINITNVESLNKSFDRLKTILEEVNEIEEQTTSRVVSKKFTENINAFKKSIPRWTKLFEDESVHYSAKWNTFYYVDINKKYSKTESKAIQEVCPNVKVGQLDWKQINDEEEKYHSFREVFYPFFNPSLNSKRVYIASTKDTQTGVYWSDRVNKIQSYSLYDRKGRKDEQYLVVCKAKVKSHLLD